MVRCIIDSFKLLSKTVVKTLQSFFHNIKRPVKFIRPRKRALGVLLCYNDADFLPEAIEALLNSNHELIVWDHGSTDATPQVLDKFQSVFVKRFFLPRSFDFYNLYQEVSKN